MWASITQVREESRAITLIMNMKGKPLDLALTVDESLLKTKEENKEANLHVGVELLIAKLDEVYYQKTESTSKLEDIERLRKQPDQPMPEVIQIFESLSRDLLKEGTVLPDSILAKKLLKVANLNESDEKLARATCPTLTTAEMKKSLLRLADTQTTKRYGESKMPTMKTEPCFMASTDYQHPSGPHSNEPPYPYQPYPHEEIMFNRNTRGQRGRFQRPNFEPRNNVYQNRQCFGCYCPTTGSEIVHSCQQQDPRGKRTINSDLHTNTPPDLTIIKINLPTIIKINLPTIKGRGTPQTASLDKDHP